MSNIVDIVPKPHAKVNRQSNKYTMFFGLRREIVTDRRSVVLFSERRKKTCLQAADGRAGDRQRGGSVARAFATGQPKQA
jgi:hypothetical protein